jgi:protein involved in polysaccharide export with SLBB domain
MKAIISSLVLSLIALAPLHAEQKAEPTVVVGGQVRSPGPVKHSKDLTLFAAIQSARGATEFGALNRVKLIRGKEAKVYDLRKDESKTLKLMAGDVIEVPQKNFIGR